LSQSGRGWPGTDAARHRDLNETLRDSDFCTAEKTKFRRRSTSLGRKPLAALAPALAGEKKKKRSRAQATRRFSGSTPDAEEIALVLGRAPTSLMNYRKTAPETDPTPSTRRRTRSTCDSAVRSHDRRCCAGSSHPYIPLIVMGPIESGPLGRPCGMAGALLRAGADEHGDQRHPMSAIVARTFVQRPFDSYVKKIQIARPFDLMPRPCGRQTRVVCGNFSRAAWSRRFGIRRDGKMGAASCQGSQLRSPRWSKDSLECRARAEIQAAARVTQQHGRLREKPQTARSHTSADPERRPAKAIALCAHLMIHTAARSRWLPPSNAKRGRRPSNEKPTDGAAPRTAKTCYGKCARRGPPKSRASLEAHPESVPLTCDATCVG
jgi:hypothetical protein